MKTSKSITHQSKMRAAIDIASAITLSFVMAATLGSINPINIPVMATLEVGMPDCFGVKATIWKGGTFHGTNGNDVIVGTSGADKIYGSGGNDRICGRGGGDTLVGEGGADRLYGEYGMDLLVGGSGTDFANGGPDEDFCFTESVLNCEPHKPAG